mgnify:CR=1 FL=1
MGRASGLDGRMGASANDSRWQPAAPPSARIHPVIGASENNALWHGSGDGMRGFASPTLILGILSGVLALMLVVAVKWGQAQAEGRAEAEAQARQWQAVSLECSLSVEKAAKAGQEASRKAAAALAAARQGSIASQTELARLKASMGQKATCQAAVARVREGLK